MQGSHHSRRLDPGSLIRGSKHPLTLGLGNGMINGGLGTYVHGALIPAATETLIRDLQSQWLTVSSAVRYCCYEYHFIYIHALISSPLQVCNNYYTPSQPACV